ncbi:MAG: hypothetical protein KDK70_41155, partial [Myxococcales bacterium]|nr:hypothetical protein [Myxococcales bacterium]
MLASPVSRVSSLLVAATLCAAPLPSMAAPGKRGKKAKPAETAEAAAPATDGRTIALMRFTGTEAAAELRVTLQTALVDVGYGVKGVALDVTEATKKVKCKGAPDGDECLAAVGKWLNANPKTAADFILLGDVDEGNHVVLVVFDIAKGKRVTTFETAFHEGDLILPIVLPQQLVTTLDQYREPPPPITDEEKEIIAALDEPEQTPEEIAA